jgi:hypothetical protein
MSSFVKRMIFRQSGSMQKGNTAKKAIERMNGKFDAIRTLVCEFLNRATGKKWAIKVRAKANNTLHL